jgi:predicted ATPase
MHLPLYLLHVALAYERSGDWAAAEARADEALETIEETAERWIEPEIRRVRARVVGRGPEGSDDQWEKELRVALRQAQLLSARGFELRIACDLYDLLARHDRKREARDLLTPIFVAFREGLGTQDLRRARSLLE